MPITELNRKVNNKIKTSVRRTGDTVAITSTYLRKITTIRRKYENGRLISTNEFETYNTRFELKDNSDLGTGVCWYNQEIIYESNSYLFDVFQWGNTYVFLGDDNNKYEVEHISGNQWKYKGELI